MTRFPRPSSLALVIASLALFVPLAADARSAIDLSKPLVTDPRDAGGKLDLRGAKRISKDRACPVTISTWGTWSSTILQGTNYVPGKNKLIVLYDLNGDDKADLTGYVIFAPGGAIYLFITVLDGTLTPGRAARPTPSSVTVPLCVPLFALERIPTAVRVAFATVNRTHRDRMPNHGWIRLRFP